MTSFVQARTGVVPISARIEPGSAVFFVAPAGGFIRRTDKGD
jgi:hypothetical protein